RVHGYLIARIARILNGKIPDVGDILDQWVRRLVEGMEELEVAELPFRLYITDLLEPGAIIKLHFSCFLELAQCRGDGIVEFPDMIGRNLATEGSPHLVDQARRLVPLRPHMPQADRIRFTIGVLGQTA